MGNNREITHVNLKDKDGRDYLCPVDPAGSEPDFIELDLNVCFERDVPERYAGNIHIKDS